MDDRSGASIVGSQTSLAGMVTVKDERDLSVRPDPASTLTNVGVLAGLASTTIWLLVGGPFGWAMLAVLALSIIAGLLPLIERSPDPFVAFSIQVAYLKALIVDSIAQDHFHNASLRLSIGVKKYKEIFEYIKEYKTSKKYHYELVYYFTHELDNGRRDLLWLVDGDYRSLVLPQYVQLSQQYLMMVLAYWEIIDDLKVFQGSHQVTMADLLQRFESDLSACTDQAIESYRYGLKKLIEKSLNPGLARRPNWRDYNELRNDLTVTALDLVASWPCLHPERYVSSVDYRSLNRRLMKVWYTSNEEEVDLIFRGDIESLEEKYNKPVKVLSLTGMQTLGQEFLYNAHPGGGLMVASCVTEIECEKQSVDGYEISFSHPHTRIPIRELENSHINYSKSESIEIPSKLFLLRALYFNGHARPDWSHHSPPVPGIWKFILYNKQKEGYERKEFILTPNLPSDANSPIISSGLNAGIPDWTDTEFPIDASIFSHSLADVQILFDQRVRGDSYLVGFYHESMTRDLLPLKTHVGGSSRSNAVLQLPAIRAAKSIDDQQLNIIAGPGFTGGDLVELKAGSQIAFRFEKDASRWFGGKYSARVWHILPAQDIMVRVDVSSDGSALDSRVEMQFPGRGGSPSPDLGNLKHSDLKLTTFGGSLLITPALSSFTLMLHNLNTDNVGLVVDRIELVFLAAATHSAVSVSN